MESRFQEATRGLREPVYKMAIIDHFKLSNDQPAAKPLPHRASVPSPLEAAGLEAFWRRALQTSARTSAAPGAEGAFVGD